LEMLLASRSSASIRERIPLAAVAVSWSIILRRPFVQSTGRADRKLKAAVFSADESAQ
jgi:hypothetical protein